MSVRACSRLGGYEPGSPDNPVVKKVLSRLLTPYLADLFVDDQPEKVHFTYFKGINSIFLRAKLTAVLNSKYLCPRTMPKEF